MTFLRRLRRDIMTFIAGLHIHARNSRNFKLTKRSFLKTKLSTSSSTGASITLCPFINWSKPAPLSITLKTFLVQEKLNEFNNNHLLTNGISKGPVPSNEGKLTRMNILAKSLFSSHTMLIYILLNNF